VTYVCHILDKKSLLGKKYLIFTLSAKNKVAIWAGLKSHPSFLNEGYHKCGTNHLQLNNKGVKTGRAKSLGGIARPELFH
jgi:hypothetical protein